jgi:acyl-CoA thioesterase-1
MSIPHASPEDAWYAQVPEHLLDTFPEAFAYVQDDPALPRVMLIGDSISIGYTPTVRRLLAGRANVHRPPDNGAHTAHGLDRLDAWLGDRPWHVIHLNFGLHDVAYVNQEGERVAPAQGHHQVSEADYAENLRTLIDQMAASGAQLIWATTTPIPPGAAHRKLGDEIRYNAIANEIMREAGIPINDLHGFIEPHLDTLQRPANVHFTEAGSVLLGERVAQVIQGALDEPEKGGTAS